MTGVKTKAQNAFQFLPILMAVVYSAIGVFVLSYSPDHPLFAERVYNLWLFLGQMLTAIYVVWRRKDTAWDENKITAAVNIGGLSVVAIVFDWFFRKMPWPTSLSGVLLSWYGWWIVTGLLTLPLMTQRKAAMGRLYADVKRFVKQSIGKLYGRYGFFSILVLVCYFLLPFALGRKNSKPGSMIEMWVWAVQAMVGAVNGGSAGKPGIAVAYWTVGYGVTVALLWLLLEGAAKLKKRKRRKATKETDMNMPEKQNDVEDHPADGRESRKDQKPKPGMPLPAGGGNWSGLFGAIVAATFLGLFIYERTNAGLFTRLVGDLRDAKAGTGIDLVDYILCWLIVGGMLGFFASAIVAFRKRQNSANHLQASAVFAAIVAMAFLLLKRADIPQTIEKLGGNWQIYIGLAFKIFLLIAAIALLVVILAFTALMCGAALKNVWKTGREENELNKQGSIMQPLTFLKSVIQSRAFYVILTGVIITMYFILPLILGNGGSEKSSNLNPMVDRWATSVIIIANKIYPFSTGDTSGGSEGLHALEQYTLVYIAVLGIGTAAISVLYNTIKHFLGNQEGTTKNEKRDGTDFLGQYSTSIGILAVGIALLLAISGGKPEKGTELIADVGMQMICVIFIVAVIIVSLEIIRLLVDNSIARGTIIRKGVRYLFLVLVDSVLSIFLDMIRNVTIAVRSMLSSSFDVNEKLINNVMQKIKKSLFAEAEHIEKEAGEDEEDGPEGGTFRSFSGREIRKGGK